MLTSLVDANTLIQSKTLPQSTVNKWQVLTARLASLGSAAVAYSGGVDSTLLAYAAFLILGQKSAAVHIFSEVETSEQKTIAERWARQMGFQLVRLEYSALADPQFVSNPPRRCYYCKTNILKLIQTYAGKNGFEWVIEGQNVDDQDQYRPGSQAVSETGTLSPLSEAGLNKNEIRAIAKALALPVWNQPSSPCLATRFQHDNPITLKGLRRVEAAEAYLVENGFVSVRVRVHQDLARIEVDPGQIAQLVAHARPVNEYLQSLGFTYVTVDLKGYRLGSQDEGLHLENPIL